MNTYDNYMTSDPIPEYLKWIIILLVILNIVVYKKHKIYYALEDYFPHFILSCTSLAFLLFGFFVFATHGTDVYVEVFGTVLGFFISANYFSNIYKDAKDQKLKLKWFWVLGLIFFDLMLMYSIDENIAFALCLLQNIVCMIFEVNKAKKQGLKINYNK